MNITNMGDNQRIWSHNKARSGTYSNRASTRYYEITIGCEALRVPGGARTRLRLLNGGDGEGLPYPLEGRAAECEMSAHRTRCAFGTEIDRAVLGEENLAVLATVKGFFKTCLMFF